MGREYKKIQKINKTRIALKKYFMFLNARLNYNTLGVVEISEKEQYRIQKTRQIYYKYFVENDGLFSWIWAKTYIENTDFIKLAEELKNEILRSEDNGLSKN